MDSLSFVKARLAERGNRVSRIGSGSSSAPTRIGANWARPMVERAGWIFYREL
jgi:hypothetical protein